jgi:hypothetical protein
MDFKLLKKLLITFCNGLNEQLIRFDCVVRNRKYYFNFGYIRVEITIFVSIDQCNFGIKPGFKTVRVSFWNSLGWRAELFYGCLEFFPYR